jgi:phosphoribosylglycinamide formyltransferase-1
MTERFGARVGLVISNNSGAGALRRAVAAGVPTKHLSTVTHPEPERLDAAIKASLSEATVDVVLLAGFMRKVGPQTLEAYAGRILNTHPALLPRFGGPGMYGSAVHEAVLASGERVSGVSLHLVVAEYDAGPVIAQRIVEVHPDDTPETLARRVQSSERQLVVDVLGEIAHGALRLPVA